MELEHIKVIALLLTSTLAVIAFTKGVLEYTRKNTLDRALVYLELRKRFKETNSFAEIISYLDSNDDKLSKISISDKLKFLGFFDDIAIMVNSGLLNKYIATQAFGFYIQKTWNNKHMWWETNKRDSEYRILLRNLNNMCKEVEEESLLKLTKEYKF